MGQSKLVKICCIVGFLLAEAYMVFTVLAPNRPGLSPATRMLMPKESIPKVEGIEPGAKPPASAIAGRLLVGAFFFGPFGAFVGFGAGLILDGVRRKISGLKANSGADFANCRSRDDS